MFSMLPMSPGFHFLGKLGHLADADWGDDDDGQAQEREHQHANASYSLAGHDQWAPNLTRRRITLSHMDGSRDSVISEPDSILDKHSVFKLKPKDICFGDAY